MQHEGNSKLQACNNNRQNIFKMSKVPEEATETAETTDEGTERQVSGWTLNPQQPLSWMELMPRPEPERRPTELLQKLVPHP